MKLGLTALACIVAVLLAAPAAEARISLAEVKRENRAAMRGACFDRCIDWDVHFCKRVGVDRAKCAGRVTWDDHAGVQTCRVINRFKQKRGDAVIYRISKRCQPAKRAG
jgi:hypothetical protein